MASGDTMAVLLPSENEPPATVFATVENRNEHPILNFDDTVNWGAVFSFILPSNYAGGGVDVDLHWSHVATSGNVDWDISIEQIGDQAQDVDSDGFGTVTSVNTTTVPGTSGFVDIISGAISHANMSSPSAGDLMRIKVTRDAINDSAVGMAELHAVHIKEQ